MKINKYWAEVERLKLLEASIFKNENLLYLKNMATIKNNKRELKICQLPKRKK
jgi:hypothetical protein